MKYEIFINGGFANISKQYDGEITLENYEKEELLKILGEKPKPSREIHDSFIYHIKITEKGAEVKSVYDEHSLPQVIRTFIDAILSRKE